jgi:uncharacterized SAM-binding protein YcdF (DUF218 family)
MATSFYFLPKWIGFIAICWLFFVALPSIPKVRSILAAPLVVTQEQAKGDACYLLSGGNAFRERLSAAADLYHMGRVPKIILMREDRLSSYNFSAHASWTPTQWAVDFLQWRGLPRDRILIIEPSNEGLFGTLGEARTIARNLPQGVKSLVVVTSAPHTRRSLLAFRRVLPREISLESYAATSFETSDEMWLPLWIEYLKLLIYAVIA